jgi:HTH-type transcriptional regulator / antitoxin HigA
MPADPEEFSTPADFIRHELEKRNLTQADLAFVLGVPPQAINQIASGKRGISAEMAKALSAVFGVTAEYLLKLQKAVEVQAELSRARQPDPAITKKAKLVSTYPIREMAKRGWIEASPDTVDAEMAKFFGVSTTDEIPHLAHAAKKTNYEEMPGPQLAWLFRVKQIAREMVVPTYSEQGLMAALPRLRSLMTAPEETRHVPRILAECGIRYVIVQTLPAAKIDGVCFWLNEGRSPVVGMSLRFDRIDNFWFVLRHELEHVLRRHGMVTPMMDADLDGERPGGHDELPEEERVANSDFCVPKSQMDSWIARKAPFFAERDLLGFAKRLEIHPGIVAGQLRNRTANYRIFARYLEKVQFAVAPSAVVDGWGQVAPVSA